MNSIISFMNRMIPRGLRNKIVHVVRHSLASISHQKAAQYYNSFAIQNEERCFVENKQQNNEKLFSVIVPAYNPDQDHFKQLIYSVVNQHYPFWELVVVNASTDTKNRAFIEQCAQIDSRIKVIPVKNKGIAHNTNVGVSYAKGEYVAFLDHDDLIHPCALHVIAQELSDSKADIVYSDEDKIDHDSKRYYDPFSKPDWSLRLLENVNYVNHLTVVNKSLFERLHGLREEANGAQDYDFLLRAADTESVQIHHVARCLYHWRAAETSTAKNITAKPYIFLAGINALEEHFLRIRKKVKVKSIQGKPGFYRPILRKVPYDIVIGPVESTYYPETLVYIKKLRKTTKAHLIIGEWIDKYNTDSWLENYTVVSDVHDEHGVEKVSQSDVTVYLRVGALPRSSEDLDDLAAASMFFGVQIQPLMIDTSEHVIDAGLIKSTRGFEKLFRGTIIGKNTPLGNNDWVRSVDALTGDILAVARNYIVETPPVVWAHSVFVYHGPFREPRDAQTLNPQVSIAGKPKMKNIFWDSGWLHG